MQQNKGHPYESILGTLAHYLIVVFTALILHHYTDFSSDVQQIPYNKKIVPHEPNDLVSLFMDLQWAVTMIQ